MSKVYRLMEGETTQTTGSYFKIGTRDSSDWMLEVDGGSTGTFTVELLYKSKANAAGEKVRDLSGNVLQISDNRSVPVTIEYGKEVAADITAISGATVNVYLTKLFRG